MLEKTRLTVLALAATGVFAVAVLACDADDDVPAIVASVDSGTQPVVVVDSGLVVDASADATPTDGGSDASATDAGTDSASDAKND